MYDEALFHTLDKISDLDEVLVRLRSGRDEILRDWVNRVRDNRAMEAGRALSDPLLLDHLPQLFDAILARLELKRSREEAEQIAMVHGFTRRVSGYDTMATVIELVMFRRAIWAHLTAIEAPAEGASAAMERIDGMIDRTVIISLKSFLDPAAGMLARVRDPDARHDL